MSDADAPFGLPRCIDCSYLLTGLTAGACPECGRKFDTSDASSVSFGRRVPSAARAVLSPPGWLLISASAITPIWAAIAFSAPVGGPVMAGVFCSIFLLGTAVVYLVRIALACSANVWFKQDWARTRIGRWIAPALLLAAALLIATTDIASAARFALSQRALEKFAADAIKTGQPSKSQSVGSYSFSDITTSGGAAYLHMPQYGLLDWPILIYSPSGPPSPGTLPRRVYGVSHYRGDWYTATFKF